MTAEIIIHEIQCPYCWELYDVVIDNCGENQQYIEDCRVCCRPINFQISVECASPQIQINAYTENDA